MTSLKFRVKQLSSNEVEITVVPTRASRTDGLVAAPDWLTAPCTQEECDRYNADPNAWAKWSAAGGDPLRVRV
jgi:hypothetical protein